MRDVGHLAQATGSLLTTFFSTSAKSGDNLIRTFTATEKRCTAWMRSVAGQKSLRTFFADAADNTKAFFSALGPLVSTFVRLSASLAPVSTGMLHFATALGDIIHWIAQLAPARFTLQAFGALVAGAFVVNKIVAWGAGVRAAGVSLGIPKPLSFAYPAYATDTAALTTLAEQGYVFARVGGGRAYDPSRDHSLLVPSFSTSGEDRAPIERAGRAHAGAHRRAADGNLTEPLLRLVQPPPVAGHRLRPRAELLAQRHRHRVLQLRAAHL
jgi:hypothetical protein